MAFSSYLDNKLIDHTFGAGSFTKPATLYLALTVAGVEVSGNGYARQAATFDISTNTATLHADVNFPAATANWGTIDGVAVYDAATVGNQLASGVLSPAKAVNSGDIFRAPAGGITISVS